MGSSDATPAFNLCDATAYKGDSALVTVGTIASGTWNGTAIANGYLANSSITLSDGSNTTAVSLGGTMTFSGTSNEVDVAESSGTVTVGLPATVSGLTHVSATCLTGTLQTAAQTNVTSLGTLTALTVDNICLDGSTIGHTSDTDLITLADGAVTIAGDLTISGDDLTMGTNTSGHILVADGTNYNPVAVSGDVSINSSGAVTIAATSVENSMLAGSIANSKLSNSSVSYGGVSLSLGDTDATPAFNLCDATAYKGDSALVTVGTVASGTWQGTAVATAYIAGTICDKTLASPVLCGTISGNAFLDEDNMASDSATKVASQQSIKAYVDSVASGLDLKCSSHAATTANLSAAYNNGTSGVGATLTNSGTQAALSVDGQTMASGERVLVKDQSTAAQNGIYTVTTVGDGSTNWVLTRATDFDTSTEITSGAFTFVETGSSNADSGWVMTTDGTVTVGTTSLSWSQFSGAGQITAGDGMTKSGNTLNVGAGSNLLVSADAVAMCSIVTGLTTVCATNFAGTLATAAQTNVTSVGTLTALTVDNICLDGTTIGHTDDTDLMTLADGVLTVSGRLDAANDIKVDAIRRYSDSSTTTKILLNDEVIKLNAGHASNEVVKIESGAVTIDGDLTICGDDITMGTNTSGHILVADGTNYNPVAVSGDVTISNTGAVTIAATSVENSMLAGSIANSKLVNDSVSYGGVSLDLGGTDATPAFNLCDATAYKGDSALVTVGTITSGTWNGTAIASAYLASDTAHLSGTQTFSGAKTFSAATQFSNTVTVGVDDTGYDVKFFGATSGRYLLWDETNDRLKLRDNTKLVFGQSNDLEIYHDATDTIITNCTGKLKVLGDKFRFNNAADSESMLIADADAAVKLYYNGSVKMETTNTGMDVTGTVCSTNLNASSVYIGGTTSANQLDNYVEGTFTPAYTAGSGSITLSTAHGYYTRIGNLVYVTIKMIASAISSPSGTLVISGLPVTSANNTGGEGIGAVVHKNLVIQTSRTSPYVPFELTGGSADNIPITSVRAHAVVRVVANSTTAKLSYVDNDVSYTDAVASDIAADTEIHASFFYQV